LGGHERSKCLPADGEIPTFVEPMFRHCQVDIVRGGGLAVLGFDHERLTYRYAGRDFRLTDVSGTAVRDTSA